MVFEPGQAERQPVADEPQGVEVDRSDQRDGAADIGVDPRDVVVRRAADAEDASPDRRRPKLPADGGERRAGAQQAVGIPGRGRGQQVRAGSTKLSVAPADRVIAPRPMVTLATPE